MITPEDLDLPQHFSEWRPHQIEVASKAASTSKYALLVDAPTGAGKSLIGAAAQRIFDHNALYVVTTKQLQDQLLRDFPYARTVMGRTNYRCARFPSAFPGISAETCTHSKANPCSVVDKCEYIAAKRKALSAPLAILNTAYYLNEINFVGAFSESKFVILDEVDMLDNQLMSFVELLVTKRMLDSLNLPSPKYKTKFEAWVDWARIALKTTVNELKEVEKQVQNPWQVEDFGLMKKRKTLSNFVAKLTFFVKNVDDTWVWYPEENKWTFKPVWVSKYASMNLWRHVEKVLGMSATILDARQVASNTGLKEKFDYVQLPSLFPAENRPILYEPIAHVVNRNIENALPLITSRIRGIVDEYPNSKILIHTVSYKIRQYVMSNIQNKRLVTHDITNRTKVLNSFKESKEPLVLVSPSMERGVDLPQDECRVIIVAKMPYPSLGDPQVKKRVYGGKDGNNWFAHKTISSLVQSTGRGVRSKDDFAETYILDQQFENLYTEYKNIFPGWWREALIT